MFRAEHKQILRLKELCQCGDPAEALLNGVLYCDRCFRFFKPTGRRRGTHYKNK